MKINFVSALHQRKTIAPATCKILYPISILYPSTHALAIIHFFYSFLCSLFPSDTLLLLLPFSCSRLRFRLSHLAPRSLHFSSIRSYTFTSQPRIIRSPFPIFILARCVSISRHQTLFSFLSMHGYFTCARGRYSPGLNHDFLRFALSRGADFHHAL